MDLEATCTFARKKQFSLSLDFNLSKGKRVDVKSGREEKTTR
ncbi:hypothetical protein [Parabacteroides distasonis]|nr:hypothetical protein [Parabacteroides distasonis]